MSNAPAYVEKLTEPAREMYVRTCRAYQSGKKPVFESECCGRCGGTGRMPFAVYGGLCFKCSGAGFILTKRGVEANKRLEQLRSQPAGDLKVGDTIRYDFSVGFANLVRAFGRVTSISTINADNAIYSVEPDGTRVPMNVGHLLIEIESPQYGSGSTVLAPEAPVRVAQTAEQKEATLIAALEYQATLTKAGKPAKRMTQDRA